MIQINNYIQEKLYIGKGYKVLEKDLRKIRDVLEETLVKELNFNINEFNIYVMVKSRSDDTPIGLLYKTNKYIGTCDKVKDKIKKVFGMANMKYEIKEEHGPLNGYDALTIIAVK